MIGALADLFGDDRYTAMGAALSSDAILIWLYVFADVLICLTYLAIGATFLLNRRKVVTFLRWVYFEPRMLALFGTSITVSGLTFATKTLTLFVGVYYLDWICRCVAAALGIATMWETVKAFYGSRDLPSIVQALEIPMAEPYGPPRVPADD